MRAVILAAGKGTRLKPFTDTMPKPLVSVGSKRLLEHVLDALPPTIDEIIIVVGYLGEMIQEYIGASYQSIPVRYVTQRILDGTGGALELLQQDIHEPTLVANADDIYAKEDLFRLTQFPLAVLARLTRDAVAYPFLVSNENLLRGFMPKGDVIVGVEHWQNCGAYMLDRRYFSLPVVEIPVRDSGVEASVPHTLAELARTEKVHVVEATFWMPVGTPEEFARAYAVMQDQSDTVA